MKSLKEFLETPDILEMDLENFHISKGKDNNFEEALYIHDRNQEFWETFICAVYKGKTVPWIMCWIKDFSTQHFNDLETAITYVLLHNHSKRLGNVFCQD